MLKKVISVLRAWRFFVPKLLKFDQKNRRHDVNDDSDLLKKVIPGDESLVYDYDMDTKAQSS